MCVQMYGVFVGLCVWSVCVCVDVCGMFASLCAGVCVCVWMCVGVFAGLVCAGVGFCRSMYVVCVCIDVCAGVWVMFTGLCGVCRDMHVSQQICPCGLCDIDLWWGFLGHLSFLG